MMAPTKMKLRVRKKEKGSVKSSQQQQQQPLRPETSPDSKCPICLDRFVNVASVERCLHRFCFRCIREWAKNKAECPLCKQPFRSIFHSVRAENDFKEFVVLEENAQSATTSASATVTLTAAALAAAPAGQNDTESTATRTRHSRATRTRQRRSQRAQDPTPSASSVEGVPLDHATLVQRNPACLRQLLPLLRRERVMGANPSELRPFLLARTDHILHELVSFARSIEAMQCPPAPSYEEDSGSQSSIINISEDDDDSVEADVTEDNTQERVPPIPMATSSEISLSQSAWDDETPGPSYSTLSLSQTEDMEPEGNQSGGTSAATEQHEHNDNEGNGEEEECMIVGYVKPMAERTPELVQLSSDSTEEEGGNEAAATETVMKAETSLLSHEQAPLSPKPYPSTSHTEREENLEQSTEQDAGKRSQHRRKDHAPRRSFRKSSHSVSGSRSQTSSESSPQSRHSVKISRSHIRLSCRESRRQSHHMLGQSPTAFAEREGSSSEEHVPARSSYVRDKSSKSFSPWDSPSIDGERKKKRRKRRRERETERSRSPHRESRHRHGDRELWLRSSSSSSDADLCREKPAGKRKYKTRHLERTARRRKSGKSRERERERERSPSVEIIFERRASDTHMRGRRRRKRMRRREREQTSPTIITIDSDSNSDHTGQTRQTEAYSHAADLQNHLIDEDRDGGNNHTADSQDRTADDNEHITDFSDHTIDYQERLAELSDRTTDDKDCVTDSRNCTSDYKDHVSDRTTAYQNCGTVFSDHIAEYKDSVAGDSIQTSNCKDKVTRVADYTTEYKHSVRKVTDQAAEHQDHAADVSSRSADYKHCVTEVNSNSTDYKDHVKEVSGHTAHSKPARTTDSQESLLDGDDSPDRFQDSVTDISSRGEPSASVLGMLNLEHCLVDMVQPIRRVDDGGHSAASPLSHTRLLELEDSLLGEGQGMLRNCSVDQQEVGLVAHRDQSESGMETEHTDVTRDSHISAEKSPDV
ncbi:E3 ubiquitin-protein ligase Topors-like [Hemibagrus wyckioides]|nr:E3 ubiquitin-protein ligase Topors-like [Hemibagrus wyckioides]